MPNTSFAALKKSSLPGPDDITRRELENGIILLMRPNFNTLSVSVSGYLMAGSLYEPLHKMGLADFVSSCLMRGTETRSFQEIYSGLESIGASLAFSGGTHTAGFSGKSLGTDLDILIETIGEVLRQPTFPADHVERLRSQLLTALDLRAQNTSEMASLAFDEIVYEGHPYQYPNEGMSDTVSAITRQDLIAFHSHHYGPQEMVIAVAGAVEPEKAFQVITKALGDWKNLEQPAVKTVPPAPSLEKTISRHYTIPDKSQTDIVLGAAGPPRSSPDFYPAKIGNSVLGQFGMMGRIGEAVRKRAGLAYYAYSSLSSSMGPGPWTVSAGVDPEDIERAIQLIMDELERFLSQPVPEQEFADSQSSYIGKLPLALESNAGVAGSLLNIERYQLGLDYFHRYEDMIREITPQDAFQMANKYLDLGRLGIGTAGP
jgi:zinc protease